MADDISRNANLWPESGKVRVSDSDILTDMASRVDLGEATPLSPDSVYAAFLEAKKASDAWVKYHFISVALLVVAAAGATDELNLLGIKIKAQFIAPAAIVSFSVSTLAFTNHELKMRLFRAFFRVLLESRNGSERADILFLYPLAYYGTEYLPYASRPAHAIFGLRHLLRTLPAICVIGIGWLAIIGLAQLGFYVAEKVFQDKTLPWTVKASVLVFFLCALILSSQLLRRAKKKHEYELLEGEERERLLATQKGRKKA